MKKFRDRAYGVADGTHLKKLKPSPVSEAEERAQYWESRGYHFNPDFYTTVNLWFFCSSCFN
jgi:hypothetical protein